ncbi:hypothetical protein NG796_07895 [Laspinema sp. A4]|nr:hypothetical protein [Laspinema sp. D2d]MCT7983213.1 hypothetical protein [Laspinema sp. D2d]
MVYWENNNTQGAFTPERGEVLQGLGVGLYRDGITEAVDSNEVGLGRG